MDLLDRVCPENMIFLDRIFPVSMDLLDRVCPEDMTFRDRYFLKYIQNMIFLDRICMS